MTILCYHTVEPACATRMAVEPGDFAAQMAHIAATRTVIEPTRVGDCLDRRWLLPRGQVVITFDDGFAGVLHHAAPVLARHGMPAIVFVVAQTLVDPPRHVDWVDDAPPGPPMATLTADDLAALADAGVMVGSHSWRHADLPSLSEAEVLSDLRDAKELLEEVVGGPVSQLAYPRGRHAPHVRAAAQRAGHDIAYGLPTQREDLSMMSVPRVGIYPGNTMTQFRVKTARRYLDVRLSRSAQTLRAALSRTRSA